MFKQQSVDRSIKRLVKRITNAALIHLRMHLATSVDVLPSENQVLCEYRTHGK